MLHTGNAMTTATSAIHMSNARVRRTLQRVDLLRLPAYQRYTQRRAVADSGMQGSVHDFGSQHWFMITNGALTCAPGGTRTPGPLLRRS